MNRQSKLLCTLALLAALTAADAAAKSVYRKLAKQGYATSQYELGNAYYNGIDEKQSYEEAVYWYRQSSNQGYVDAKVALGNCYMNGTGVAQDYNRAIELYRSAAEKWSSTAQIAIAKCYSDGKGVEQNYDAAIAYYDMAIAQGNENATILCDAMMDAIDVETQYSLGMQHSKIKDYLVATRLMTRAAENGKTEAQYWLANCYKYGHNTSIPKNGDKAIEWYTKAAEGENYEAQYALGECYDKGDLVPQDYSKADYWYKKAALQCMNAPSAEEAESYDWDDRYSIFGDCCFWGLKDKNGTAKWWEKLPNKAMPRRYIGLVVGI